MKTLELFSGSKSFSKVSESLGHFAVTIDNNPLLDPDECIDIYKMDCLNSEKYDFVNLDFDVLWASPPCTAFSVASIGKNWTGGRRAYIPMSWNAHYGLKLLEKTIQLIVRLNPTYWYIENPRGMMRKFIDGILKKYGIIDYRCVTLTYCQYGDSRMKPTDIWTNNLDWIPKPMCKNGSTCHVRAPRGSKTGTQGLKDAQLRGVIPKQLFFEIFESMSDRLESNVQVKVHGKKKRRRTEGAIPPKDESLGILAHDL